MNSKKQIPSVLYIYSIYLLFIVLALFVSLVTSFHILFSINTAIVLILYLSSFIMFILYLLSFILIYKRTKYSINCNKLVLVVSFFLNAYVFYLTLNKVSEAPQFIKNFLYLFDFIITMIPITFLGYWQFSKRVKDFYSDISVLDTIPLQTTVENLNSGIVNQTSNITNVKSSEPIVIKGGGEYLSLHLAIMTTIALLTCFMFNLTGWGTFFYTPIAFVFSIIYSIIFTKIFKKSTVSAFSVYTVIFTLLFGYIAVLLNIGIITDGDLAYIIPMYLGIPDKTFANTFSTLTYASLIYLLLSVPLNIDLIKKNVSKKIFAVVPFIGLLLIIIHLVIVWRQFPQLRDKIIEDKKQEEINKQISIERAYEFDWNKISKNTIKNRVYSIFTPPSFTADYKTIDCPYIVNMIYQGVAITNESLDFKCLNDSIKSVGTVPIIKNEPISFSILNNNQEFKKGDILAVVVELDNPSLLRIYANGNAAKDCACRMAPYAYDDIKESMKVGTSTIIYEQSVVQMQVTDKKRTVMMLYPINVNNLKKISILASQFSNMPGRTVSLKEVAVFSPTKPTLEPEWLNKWRKQPNPFLNEK